VTKVVYQPLSGKPKLSIRHAQLPETTELQHRQTQRKCIMCFLQGSSNHTENWRTNQLPQILAVAMLSMLCATTLKMHNARPSRTPAQ